MKFQKSPSTYVELIIEEYVDDGNDSEYVKNFPDCLYKLFRRFKSFSKKKSIDMDWEEVLLKFRNEYDPNNYMQL